MKLSGVTMLCVLVSPILSAANLPTGFTETVLSAALSGATAMALAPDGRILVCEQGGTVRVIKNGALLAQPFLSLTVNSVGERGLLGIALDPDFQTNNFVYLYYTATSPSIHNRISRFTASGDVAAPDEVILLELDNLSSATNHNGGALHFGPDGKLYASVGENANGSNSQSLSNLLGKVLRIETDGTIPADNPFYGQTTGQNRAIWALGLRNPFTFSFQPGTGRMFINDVGEAAWEEINDGLAGANYGWPTTEGETSDPRFVSPLFAYGHGTSPTLGCAITGGAFYNPLNRRFPANYVGKYFFGDYCSGWIRTYDPVSDTASGFATGAGLIVDFIVSDNGRMYYLNRSSIREVDYTLGAPAAVSVTPSSGSGSVQAFSFMFSDANGFADLRWVQMLFADVPEGQGGNYCFVHYDVQANSFWLFGDGGFFVGPVAPGTLSNRLQNSVCALSTAGSTASGKTTDLTVNAALTFKQGLTTKVFVRAQDMAGVDTGWIQRGNWTLLAASQDMMSVTPASGTGGSQTFTLTYPDQPGFSGVAAGWMQFLVATASDGGGQPFCFVHYDRAGNGLWMYSSDVGFFLGPVAPGTASNALNSSACSVNTAAATATNASGNVVVTVPLTMKAPISGTKKSFQRTLDVLNRDTGWHQSGTWNIP